ncbi:hypothetical protein RE428_32080 [Marinobacter nanhaiticus D15-8W]|uniref:Uncharacterized protein n=1 Tax=Marinobacter nanhaiticus D15-8W TaxID=626887 RepID=N6W2Y2_9GAMM|nr:hypothetical protein [Marinobacter nanhaiticus]ENO16900.1 hypothetical protein J057_01810 [Marinobacter nanhaiticus D15-8W]BES72190.1 hypothetical protein RE428_32080 [Marinobacter nanhaiticus D15-8W]
MKDIRISYWWQFHVKGASDGSIRSMAAWFFRKIGSLIDGKPSLTVDIESTPCVSKQEQVEIIRRGLDEASKMFEAAVRREAMEVAMRETHPERYEARP